VTTRKRIDWDSPDLDDIGLVPDREIAERAGCTRFAVSLYRYRHGIVCVREFRGKPKADWGAVDWSRSPTDIARDLGVSRQAVHTWRRRLARGAA